MTAIVSRALLTVLALLSACGISKVVIPDKAALDSDLVSSMRAWNSSRIESYRYELRITSSDECPLPSLEIVVRNHLAETIRFGENWIDCTTRKVHHRGANAEAQFSIHKQTIGDLFVQLVSASQRPFGGSAYFHPKYGFPVLYRFVYPGFTEHDYQYHVTRFEYSRISNKALHERDE